MSDAGGGVTGSTVSEISERVWALREFGRTDDALKEARAGLAEYPDDPELLGSVAWIEWFHGDKQAAEEFAKRTLAARPDDWRGLIITVECAVLKTQLDDAESHARRLIEVYPDDAAAYLTLAYVHGQRTGGGRKAKQARETEVRELLTRALELDPEGLDTLRRSAVMFSDIGDAIQSSDAMQRALELYPDNEELLMLVAESPDTSEVEGLRVLTGVLAQNPQQRAAARSVSDRLWSRTTWLAVSLLILLSALLLYGYLLFQEGMSVSHYQSRQIGYALLAIGGGWIFVLLRFPAALPKGYLKRLFKPVWWVWIGILLSGGVFLLSLLVTLALAARSQPANYKLNGPYIGGITALVAVLLVLVLVSELLLISAAAASERRNRLFATGPGSDDTDRAAAKAKFKQLLISVALRGVFAVLLWCLPLYAGGIATRPEAAGAFPTLAIAVAAPPVVALLLFCANFTANFTPRDVVITMRRTVTLTVLACLVAVGSVVAAYSLAYQHILENDPPPTPWQLEMQERTAKINEDSKRRMEENARLEQAIKEIQEELAQNTP